eukprot:gnl/TRDRNA2_/TRDRNA2_117035_c3_seq1.p1 gnl/TRDRNA2_/TRDRNA2_117035_c3~~gnl/TRDRNA2_/TRDRNA2_117035_c3_seq1.p1  ORF type:complete len:115 (+),score=8.56 gnl/TRDRNA2_/TRDRNA2_117035_c3_seq1:223-567(+)
MFLKHIAGVTPHTRATGKAKEKVHRSVACIGKDNSERGNRMIRPLEGEDYISHFNCKEAAILVHDVVDPNYRAQVASAFGASHQICAVEPMTAPPPLCFESSAIRLYLRDLSQK